MATSSDIQAGRAAISVVLDDAQVQPQMQALSARLKTASAGLTAATLPTMGADATGPVREYARQLADLDRQFQNGLRSPSEYNRAVSDLARQFNASASPAQALGGRFAELDSQLKQGKISQDQYRQQSQALAAQFVATAGPVDRLQGELVALDRDLRVGAISESEHRRAVEALHREFTAAASPADRFAAEVATLDAQLKQGKISQDQHTEATRKAKTALESSQQAASKKGGAMRSLGSQLATLAAGYVSWTAILNVAGKALEFVRQETEKAKQSQDGLVDSRRRLAQVATSEDDLAAMLERADQAAMKFGVDRKKAQEVMFSARSEGFEQDYEMILQNSTVVCPNAAAGVAGQVPGLFKQTEDISSEQAISGTLAAAQ
jgi:chromosome segregation ATPase